MTDITTAEVDREVAARQKFSAQVDQFISDLNALRNFVVDHPDVPTPVLPDELNSFLYGAASGDGLAAAARAMKDRAPVGSVRKNFGSAFASVERDFGSLTLAVNAYREEVCEQVVVGTETVEVPDPEALAAVPTVTEEREITEWVCAPLLSVDEPVVRVMADTFEQDMRDAGRGHLLASTPTRSDWVDNEQLADAAAERHGAIRRPDTPEEVQASWDEYEASLEAHRQAAEDEAAERGRCA